MKEDKGRPKKMFVSTQWQIVAVGMLLFVVLFLIINYAVNKYAGVLWAESWADLQPEVIEQIQTASRRLVLSIFIAIFPIYTIGTVVFSYRFLAPYRNLTKDAVDRIEGLAASEDRNSEKNTRISAGNEIDELKHMMTAMMDHVHKTDEQFRSVVSNQRDLIHRWRPDFSITFVNEAFCEFFGKPRSFWLTTAQESLAQALAEDYPELMELINHELLATLSLSNPEVISETYLTLPDGETRWVQWVSLGLFGENDQLVECQTIGHDITDLKHAQMEVERVNQQLTDLSQELIIAQEAERASLSRYLHDDILGELGQIVRNPSESNINIASIQKVIERLRSTIYRMRSPMLGYGLSIALEDMADSFIEMVDDAPGVEYLYEVPGNLARFNTEVETHIYRIIQQASQNALDHSGASIIRLRGKISQELIDLVVEDNGSGFQLDAMKQESLAQSQHFGLIGMRERCKIIGAHLEIDTSPGRGTHIRVWWQLGDTHDLLFPSPSAKKFQEATASYKLDPEEVRD